MVDTPQAGGDTAPDNAAAGPVMRVSALAGHNKPGKFGAVDGDGQAGVVLEDVGNLVLSQVASWPDQLEAVGAETASALGLSQAPGPCRAVEGENDGAGVAMLRIEPLKWWLVGAPAPSLEADQGVTLDLSHSRTRIRISGARAADFLNRFLPLDLRESSFPEGAVASSVIHHVGVTLWRSSQGYELFIPRGFALSLWEGLVESAQQFGLEIV